MAGKKPNERLGFRSIFGFIADFIAIGTFGYSLINAQPGGPNISVLPWIGLLTIVPLIYFWGYLAWTKWGKLKREDRTKRVWVATITTSIIVAPGFLTWGAAVLAQFFRWEPDPSVYPAPLLPFPEGTTTPESYLWAILITLSAMCCVAMGITLFLKGLNRLAGNEPARVQKTKAFAEHNGSENLR